MKVGPWTRSIFWWTRSMDPVHEGGPWTRGPCFVLSPFNYYVVNAVWHSLFRIHEVQTPLAIEPAKWTTQMHLCQLSRIIRESPGYGTNLPVSRTGDQFSRINTTLNLFYWLCSTLRSRRILRWREFQFLKIVLPFLNAFQDLRLSNTLDVDRN